MLLHAGLIEIFHFERLREILPEVVAGSRLQGLAVLHHRLDR